MHFDSRALRTPTYTDVSVSGVDLSVDGGRHKCQPARWRSNFEPDQPFCFVLARDFIFNWKWDQWAPPNSGNKRYNIESTSVIISSQMWSWFICKFSAGYLFKMIQLAKSRVSRVPFLLCYRAKQNVGARFFNCTKREAKATFQPFGNGNAENNGNNKWIL